MDNVNETYVSFLFFFRIFDARLKRKDTDSLVSTVSNRDELFSSLCNSHKFINTYNFIITEGSVKIEAGTPGPYELFDFLTQISQLVVIGVIIFP